MGQSWDTFIVALYEKTYDKLYRVAYRLMGNTETAKELTQDVFLLAIAHQEELFTHPKPEAWLMVALVNLARNERRRHSRYEISLDNIFDVPAKESAGGIEELLPSKLSDEDRQILIWRFEEQMDYREMANLLGITETGCRSRVSRIIRKCRKYLNIGRA